MEEQHHQESNTVAAAFSCQWRPQLAEFSESLKHVHHCQLIQFGTCPRVDCEVTVDRIEHFAYCRTISRLQARAPDDCERCQFVLSVLVQHALDCPAGRHDFCFVPDCSSLKATSTRGWVAGEPGRLVKTLLDSLTAAEVRTVVWCLGGGDPRQLLYSTGQDHVRWEVHKDSRCKM